MLRRFERAGGIGSPRALDALVDLAQFPIVRHEHLPLLERIWGLRANVTAYDAVYIALAEALAAPLLTRDHRLASAVGTEVQVLVV